MIKWQEWDLGCHMFRFTVYKIEFYRIWFVLWPYYLSGYVTVYRLLRSSTSKLSSPISLVCTRQWKCWRQQSPRSLGKLRHITCLILSICYEIARTPFPNSRACHAIMTHPFARCWSNPSTTTALLWNNICVELHNSSVKTEPALEQEPLAMALQMTGDG